MGRERILAACAVLTLTLAADVVPTAQNQPRAGEWVVVIDGQSLSTAPAGGATTFAYKTLDGTGVSYKMRAIAGTSWTTLAQTAATRSFPVGRESPRAALVMCGGQSDLCEGDTGATVYAEEVAYARGARAAGFDLVVALTIPPNAVNTEEQEAQRLVHNTALLADTDKAFDAVIDVASNPLLGDHPDRTYYYDGVHWTDSATEVVADMLHPILLPLLE